MRAEQRMLILAGWQNWGPGALVAYSRLAGCTTERARQMASDCGASALCRGAAGHLNADSGLGDWPDGRELLRAIGAAAT